jgi:uncharacterized protein
MDGIKVILHVDENDKWKKVLNNIKYIINDDNINEITIEVMANDIAVSIFAAPEQLSEDAELATIEELYRKGVVFSVCQMSLNSLGVSEEVLPHYIRTVPVGLTEIIARQHQGYAYIKP